MGKGVKEGKGGPHQTQKGNMLCPLDGPLTRAGSTARLDLCKQAHQSVGFPGQSSKVAFHCVKTSISFQNFHFTSVISPGKTPKWHFMV